CRSAPTASVYRSCPPSATSLSGSPRSSDRQPGCSALHLTLTIPPGSSSRTQPPPHTARALVASTISLTVLASCTTTPNSLHADSLLWRALPSSSSSS
ncbi:hypothetical protein CC85DRAFT_331745, partial [Cutaneotrichosporon oleaginosum]